MKIYLLEKDVDNFRSCFIKETSLDKKKLRAFNKGERLAIVDALDANETEFEVLQDIIVGVKKYMFINQQYPFMFQIKLPTGFVLRNYYVTDEFINFVNENNLKGFLFKEVWDSGN